jgi:hypothetical protein
MCDLGLDEGVGNAPILVGRGEGIAVEPGTQLVNEVLAVLPRCAAISANDDRLTTDLARCHVRTIVFSENVSVELLDGLERELRRATVNEVVFDSVEGRDDVLDLLVEVLLRGLWFGGAASDDCLDLVVAQGVPSIAVVAWAPFAR